VNPGATEVCNLIDDNCNGPIDEGVETTFYLDSDGDLFGDASQTTLACTVPAGHTSDNTDCNDGDVNVNPGATEVCNLIDDNCDAVVDDLDLDVDGFNDCTEDFCLGTPAGINVTSTPPFSGCAADQLQADIVEETKDLTLELLQLMLSNKTPAI